MRHEQIDLCIFSGLGIIGVRMVFQLFFSQGVNTDRRVVIVFFFFWIFHILPYSTKTPFVSTYHSPLRHLPRLDFESLMFLFIV